MAIATAHRWQLEMCGKRKDERCAGQAQFYRTLLQSQWDSNSTPWGVKADRGRRSRAATRSVQDSDSDRRTRSRVVAPSARVKLNAAICGEHRRVCDSLSGACRRCRIPAANRHVDSQSPARAHEAFPRFRDVFASWPSGVQLVPVYRRLLGDTLTPVSAFHKIDAGATACLFESVIGGEKVGRYSFLAADPFLQIEARGHQVTVVSADGTKQFTAADPLEELKTRVEAIRAATLPELPPFTSGAVGYAGYDVVRYSEHLPNAPADDRQLPDLAFAFYDHMVVFDNVNKTIVVVAMARLDKFGDDLQAAYDDAAAPRRRAGRAACEQPDGELPPADIGTGGEATHRVPVELHAGRVRAGRRKVRRVHPRRRHLSGRHQPAAGTARSTASRSRSTARCGS